MIQEERKLGHFGRVAEVHMNGNPCGNCLHEQYPTIKVYHL